eukprot:198232_1
MSTSMQFINTKLKEFEKESQIFIQQTPVLRNDEEFCLFAVKIMNQIINNYLELDVAFVRLFTLCRLFCDGTRQKEAKYVKRLNIFIICIAFAALNTKNKQILSSYILPKVKYQDNDDDSDLYDFVISNFFQRLSYGKHMNFKYCERETLGDTKILPISGLVTIIDDFVQFKWSPFMRVIFHLFNDEFDALDDTLLLRYPSGDSSLSIPAEYSIYHMLHGLDYELLQAPEVEMIVFEMEKLLLFEIKRRNCRWYHWNDQEFTSKLILFYNVMTLYPPWIHAKHCMELLYLVMNEKEEKVSQFITKGCRFKDRNRPKEQLFLFDGYLDIARNASTTRPHLFHQTFKENIIYIMQRVIIKYLSSDLCLEHLLYINISLFSYNQLLRDVHFPLSLKFQEMCGNNLLTPTILGAMVKLWDELRNDMCFKQYLKKRHVRYILKNAFEKCNRLKAFTT